MKKTFLAMCVLGCSSLLFAQDPVTPTPQDTTRTETTTPITTPVTTETDMSTQTDMSSQSSVSAYPAYSTTVNVPSNINHSFNTNYPGTGNVNWHQRGQWYRASYNREGRTMHTYYAPNGKNFNVALPVLRGDIPDEMINKAVSQYGDRLYAINSARTGKGDVAYRVTLIDDSNTGMDNTTMNQSGMNNTMTTGTSTQHNSDYRGLYFGPTRYEYFGEDGTTIQEIDMFRTETEDPNDPQNMNNQNMNNNQNLNNNNGTINNNNNKPTGYKKAKAKNSYAAAAKKSNRKA
ncbi:MAG: hypothetical protein H0V91_15150 [Flavisolibacter sp.]|nr:hypothetical protein [Flavisolibacter sp.]